MVSAVALAPHNEDAHYAVDNAAVVTADGNGRVLVLGTDTNFGAVRSSGAVVPHLPRRRVFAGIARSFVPDVRTGPEFASTLDHFVLSHLLLQIRYDIVPATSDERGPGIELFRGTMNVYYERPTTSITPLAIGYPT